MPKVLIVEPMKCDGCKDCETACAGRHRGDRKIARSRIDILSAVFRRGTFFVPSTCRQCVSPPCMTVCPRNAITREADRERVVIDTALCVGCGMCVSACPLGAMAFAEDRGLPYKCDLCDGDPQCVRACGKKALEYVEACGRPDPRVERSALRLFEAGGRGQMRVFPPGDRRTGFTRSGK